MFLISGPCVIESLDTALRVADHLAGIRERLSADVVVDDLNLEEIFLELHDAEPAAAAVGR